MDNGNIYTVHESWESVEDATRLIREMIIPKVTIRPKIVNGVRVGDVITVEPPPENKLKQNACVPQALAIIEKA